MTEADWLTSTDFTAHVRYVADHISLRRQRLLAAAFCRGVAQLFDHPSLRAALDVLERAADGALPITELEGARQRCRALALEAYEEYRMVADGLGAAPVEPIEGDWSLMRSEIAWAMAFALNQSLPLPDVGERVVSAAVREFGGFDQRDPVHARAVQLKKSLALRGVVWEVVGNPFRPVEFAPEWRTDTAVTLARTMYEAREFSAMPILADALQDAGCDSDDILNHCRDTSAAHVRGCWVVDLVLGNG